MESENQPSSSTPLSLKFDGQGAQFAIIVLTNLVLTLLTLGIYAAWGKVKSRQYIASHMIFTGHRFQYTGTGMELFLGYVKFLCAMVLLISTMVGMAFIHPLLPQVVILLLIPLGGYAVYASLNYRLTRTSWRGLTLGLEEDQAWKYGFSVLVGYLFSLITLGLYFPVYENRLYSQIINNMRFGSLQFKYTGKAGDVYATYILSVIFMPFTLGVSLVYLSWYLMRYRIENTYLGSAEAGAGSARLEVSFGSFFVQVLGSTILVVLTLGLALPWILTHNIAWLATHLRFTGQVDFDKAQYRDFGKQKIGAMFDGG
jgi:uncharacterized membrane protein YjgN (DUF898 family)